MHVTCMLAHYRLSLLSDTGEIGFQGKGPISTLDPWAHALNEW